MVASIRNTILRGVTFSVPITPIAPAQITLISNTASMHYYGNYLADYPAAHGGVTPAFDPAQTGANGVLTGGNTIVTFSGTGSALSTTSGTGFSNDGSVCEFVIGSSALIYVGYWTNNAYPWNPSSANPGGFPNSFFYGSDGTIVGSGTTSNPTFTTGDVIGLVGDTNNGVFYKNGIKIIETTISTYWPNTPGNVFAGAA